MRIKICGLTDLDQAVEICSWQHFSPKNLRVTDLGFICVEASPRYILPEKINEIVAALPQHILKVGVFAHHSPEKIAQIVQQANLTAAQLHSDESPQFCQQLRALLPDLTIIKALRIKDQSSLALTKQYEAVVDTLLLDAYHPEQLGGTGHTLNWHDLQQFSPRIPWLLAGGLNPDNIQTALALLQPDGVDLSSGVERSPGDKDLTKVKKLLEKISACLKEAEHSVLKHQSL